MNKNPESTEAASNDIFNTTSNNISNNVSNTANYTISEADLVQAGALHQRKSDTTKLIILVIIVALIIIGISNNNEVLSSIAIPLSIIFTVFIWVLPICNKQVFKKQYRQTKALQQANTLSLQDNGLHWQSDYGQTLLLWEHILKWKENERFLLIYQSDFLFHVIPKHINNQAFDLDDLRQRLKQHIGMSIS